MFKNDLLIITPTRGRPENIRALLKSLADTQTKADLLIVLDDDDAKLGHYLELDCQNLILKSEGRGFVKPLNEAAHINRNSYRHFAFLGDDNRPRTIGWDQEFVKALDELGTGLVYGNDLYHQENLPTAVAMTGNIVCSLYGMAPRTLTHLYADNFWLRLGQDLGAIRYLPEVIIEHLHPIVGKANWDDLYRAINAPEMYSKDQRALNDYLSSPDYEKLLKRLQNPNETDWRAIAIAHKEWQESGNAKPQGWWSI